MIGPLGQRARPHPWWTSLRLLLALGVLAYALCLLIKTPCATGGDDAGWWNSPADYANLCASDLPGSYISTGLVEGSWPLSPGAGQASAEELSAPESVLAYGAATLTRVLHGWPETADRRGMSADALTEPQQVREEAVTYTAVSAVVQLLALLAAIGCLAGVVAVEHHNRVRGGYRDHGPGRFVRLAPFAASPLVVLAGLTGWDLVPVALACAAVWAWARGHDLAGGAFVGVGTAMSVWPVVLVVALVAVTVRGPGLRAAARSAGAALVAWVAVTFPAFVLSSGRAGEFVWSYFTAGAGDGSVWKVLETLGLGLSPSTLSLVVVSLWVLVAVGAFAYAGLRSRPPQVAGLAFAVLAAVLAVGKAYEPGYALWLLPLAVLASRDWRDVWVWQVGEVFFVLATWWHLGGYTESLGGGDPMYPAAILVRIATEGWLAWRVLAGHADREGPRWAVRAQNADEARGQWAVRAQNADPGSSGG